MKERYASRISEALKSILSHLPSSASAGEGAFVEQFYARIPLPELEAMAGDHATELARDAYKFFQERPPGEPKIRIFTPAKDKSGYELHRPVIQLINDDKPFLVDSLTNELTRQGFTIFATFHPIFTVIRDGKGKLKQLAKEGETLNEAIKESFIHFEISGLPDDLTEQAFEERLRKVLRFVGYAVGDWQTIVAKVKEVCQSLSGATAYDKETIAEAESFLNWLTRKNFVFLGYVAVDFIAAGGTTTEARLDSSSFLGISREDEIPPEINLSPQLVDVRKANRQSLVHRRVLMDVITVKRIGEDGEVTGEHRFYGLFTSAAYYQTAGSIPLVAPKIERILKKAGFEPASHNGKALQTIMQLLPRDELFQINEDDLFDLSMGILALESRPGVKLFARVDIARRYISVLVFVPRELFSTDVRRLIQQTLQRAFHATQESFAIQIDDSPLARLHVVMRTTPQTPEMLDIPAAEQEIATAIMLWSDRLKTALIEAYGEHPAERLFRHYAPAFPPAYAARYDIASTLYDIRKMEQCQQEGCLAVDLYRQKDDLPGLMHLKIYNPSDEIALSDILPLLENMGLRVLDEFPFLIAPQAGPPVRMRDVRVQFTGARPFDFDRIKPLFEELLLKVWQKTVEDGRLNALVFHAELTHPQIGVLRAYTRYLKQIGFTYGQAAIEAALIHHSTIARALVELFEARFDPATRDREARCEAIKERIDAAFAEVNTLADDRILHTLVDLINATLRTNYYLRDNGVPRPILSCKFDSQAVPGLPQPKPFVEIFVYSPRVEGIHLRGGKVARGGIRWSDRHEDFRTEVLGLMKAQMVKNAVIVPVGSKGGFVVKQVQPIDRETFQKEGVECYKLYLQGLLDLTDNIRDGNTVPPKEVVRYDGDDPYLVVAADKGTASFSDIANAVSRSYGFWLDDAFASGGSVGYDHKKMGITARGAWVSVERHFREMGMNIATTPFTVTGIGDMSGDVFGNGMLLSRQIKLVAAFNHLHVFLDPDPHPEKSYAERQRLFDLPRSGWPDYQRDIISKGGGIFERSAKSIALSPEIRAVLGTDRDQCPPDELIQIILKAPVDLLFNGGIGTYVKAEDETHDQVGDRTNNNVRVGGKELRCKVVGEGGNLGFTQKGRIEYARSGGRINTDAIDNSGGVDCSDHEVNIKIALRGALDAGKFTMDERDQLLAAMTEEVARLVLRDNTLQTQAITAEELRASSLLGAHMMLMRTLERRKLLNRAIEFLPTDQQLAELRTAGKGLVRPQLAVLLAYSKIALFRDIVESSLPDEPYFAGDLARYFPKAMKDRFASEINNHPLKREIIGTVATNSMVNRAGISFYFSIAEDTQLPARDIVAAYSMARDMFGLRALWDQIEALAGQVEAATQVEMCAAIAGLLTHVTHWMLRHQKLPLSIEEINGRFAAPVQRFAEALENMHSGHTRAVYKEQEMALEARGVPLALAGRIAALDMLHAACDIITVAERHKAELIHAGKVYFALSEALHLSWLRERAQRIVTPTRWDRLALQSLLFEVDDEQRRLTESVLTCSTTELVCWQEEQKESLERYQTILADMMQRESLTTPMIMVALKQLKQVAGGVAAAG